MKYIVKTQGGKEYGPVDQEVLVQWAQTGRISADCEIRNSLMQSGNPASKVPFLKDIIENQLRAKTQNRILAPQISEIFSSDPNKSSIQAKSLNTTGQFTYTPADVKIRFGAFIVDAILVGAVGVIYFFGAANLLQGDANQHNVFVGFTLIFLFTVLMYYTVTMGFTAQTLGQWLFGIMVVRTGGQPVLMGRAFVYSVFYMLLFWSTVVFAYCLPSKRAMQDMLSGVRVITIATKK